MVFRNAVHVSIDYIVVQSYIQLFDLSKILKTEVKVSNVVSFIFYNLTFNF